MTELMKNARVVRRLWSEGSWRREMPEKPPVTGTQSPGETEDGLDRLRAAAKKNKAETKGQPFCFDLFPNKGTGTLFLPRLLVIRKTPGFAGGL